MTLRTHSRAQHRADVRPITFLSAIQVSNVARRGTVRGATAGLAFGLVAPAATAYDPGPSAASDASASTSTASASSESATYTVESGDTVAKIAAEYGASVQAIIDANDLGADALIFPGDELTIPGASGESSAQRGGDTASRDGQRSGVASAQQASNSTSPSGNAIVDTARQYVGTPYVWGGSTPSGFDCSGFTAYVFAQVGIDLPRNSGAQRGAGQVVSASEARPGDLVWWPGHIGIYTGDGNHIAARNPGTALHESPIYRDNPTFIRVA